MKDHMGESAFKTEQLDMINDRIKHGYNAPCSADRVLDTQSDIGSKNRKTTIFTCHLVPQKIIRHNSILPRLYQSSMKH